MKKGIKIPVVLCRDAQRIPIDEMCMDRDCKGDPSHRKDHCPRAQERYENRNDLVAEIKKRKRKQ